MSKYALVNIPSNIKPYIYSHLMISVTGRTLDNPFLFCKSLLELNITAGESITNLLSHYYAVNHLIRTWNTNFVANYFSLPKIVNLIKICAIFQLSTNQESFLFNSKLINHRSFFLQCYQDYQRLCMIKQRGNLHISSCFFILNDFPDIQ